MLPLAMVSLNGPIWSLSVNQQRILSMQNLFSRFVRDESGVTSIEYGLIAALISVVCIAAMTAVGTQLRAVYTGISTALAAAM
jgi:pilus assembly protein Flp/PilA